MTHTPSARQRALAQLPRFVRSRRGFALLTVMLIAIVGAVLALAASTMASSSVLIQASSDRAGALDDAALSGLEEARSKLNARLDTVPLNSYKTMESNATVAGLNGITRSVWVSRLGNADSLRNTGEFGVQAEIVSRATDASGNVAIRRSQMYQESFARYASFTDIGKNTAGQRLWWALGAQAAGPVHSNDTIYVWNGTTPSPQAIFHEDVTSARIVLNKSFAQYRKGAPKELVSRIPMPTTADLDVLKNIASRAGYVFTPLVTSGDSALTSMRIEFLAIDADGDGNTTGPNDGYFRVYRQRAGGTFPVGYAIARTPAPPAGAEVHAGSGTSLDSILYSRNCGVVSVVAGRDAMAQSFMQVPVVVAGANYRARMLNKQNAFDNVNARCFLGGDERLTTNGIFVPSDSAGDWMLRTSGSVPALIAARADGAYLWPLSAGLNPNFRGVIFAEGRVAVSGTVRGRVTIASRSNMVLPHEMLQATNPGTTTGTCRPDDDIIGLFSGEYVMYADNTIATPQWRRDNSTTGAAFTWPRKEFDPSPRRPDITVHASVLALKSVVAELSNVPAGLATNRYVTRGTIRLIGGTIESRIGQTGTMSGTNLHGYYDDLSFNRCALRYPPPYFPTTGRWSRSQFFEVDPRGFNPATWFVGR